ncbi:MAG: DciA family protein [Nocardioides sp.]|uniref:DUF721 domain-containing protein n=1 Tax=Nocardioides sp. TaxID=35761 RepID=UPI0039E326BE
MSEDEDPAAGTTAGAADEHIKPDGLDLARALTRATAGSTPKSRTRTRKRAQPGQPGQSSRGRVGAAHPDDRDPQLLDATIGRLVEEHGWQLDLKVHAVLGNWAELVGPEIADHSTPESFSDGKVVVRTDSTAWATQLRLLAPDVVRRLNAELGNGTVLQIEVLGPAGPTWKKGPRSVRDGRGPRDTYG